jgi:uncharacterized protein with GYD domain
MPVYLMRFSLTPETWSRLIQNPEDRRDTARAYVEEVGGTLKGFWYGFGEYDGYVIFEAPDNVSMAGLVLAITAGGRPGQGRDHGLDDRGRDARSPGEEQEHQLPPARGMTAARDAFRLC